ncbi:MAG: hypothetical protein REH83_02155 [Rickettsiella sp.]|nr:hypothetical protein [Rickettsiella sp.]
MAKGLKKNNNSFYSSVDIRSQGSQLNHTYQIIDTPPDGSCLFWASAVAYLSDLISESNVDNNNDVIRFSLACKRLFGEIGIENETIVKRLINKFLKNPEDSLYIYRNTVFTELNTLFRRRVVDYIQQQKDEFKGFIAGNFNSYLQSMRLLGCFGGEPEIRAIVSLLACDIEIFDVKRNAIVLHRCKASETNLVSEQTSETLFQIRTLHLFYYADRRHYCFGLLSDANFSNDALDEENSKTNSASEVESDLDSKADSEATLTPIKTNQRNKLPVFSDRISKPPVNPDQIILSYMIKGISLGVFLEVVLCIFPASPLVRSFYSEEIRKFSLVEFLQSPYLYYQNYQSLLLKATPCDELLNNILNLKKLFTTGILLGAGGGVIKALIDSDNIPQALLLSAVVLSSIPTNYFFDEKIDKMQMIVRTLLAIFLSGKGLITMIDFSLFCLRKLPIVAKSAVDSIANISKRMSSFSLFFPKKNEKPEETTMGSEAYFQSDIKASL